jgi:hypothetical protein
MEASKSLFHLKGLKQAPFLYSLDVIAKCIHNTYVRSCSMPHAIAHPNEATLNLRVDAALKEEFVAQVKAESRPVAEVLRSLMRDYVEDARKRRFAAEACRQSQLIAASEDEAEVMRWIQDVSALEGGQ